MNDSSTTNPTLASTSTSSTSGVDAPVSEGAPLIPRISTGAIIDATVATPVGTAAGGDAAQSSLIDINHFASVEMRVGQILTAEKVEKSKKLLKLQVDLGAELGTRQILSGIAQFFTPEQLVGRKIVVVANLKPATMMGLESRGMLLAVSTPDNTGLTLLDPGQTATLGSRVS
ncbi:MAG: methionine--tRNA ligase subunit beta [Proteobacteria bacterium]|nr:methionine--tRNA ligase subunit beta [Pseudomonadota bacterium]